MRSVMKHDFSMVPKATIPRSAFNRSHGLKTTLDAGYLVPIFVDEALPGDTFNLRTTLFGRLATPLYPIMDNLFLDTFYFAVPYRLVWTNWERFNGAQDDPGDSTDFTVPQMVSTAVTGYGEGSLSDYLGLPTKVPGLSHSSLWHRSYSLIWNEWFRDENLQDSVVVDKDNGPDTVTDYTLLKRGKRHDYFTSCLPWPQKGDAVTLPLGTTAPITGLGVQNPNANTFGTTNNLAETGDTAFSTTYTYSLKTNAAGAGGELFAKLSGDGTGGNAKPEIYADLSNATAATINQLREAFQLQKLLERDARGGTRYVEIIRAHFSTISPDFRLQRPELLGMRSERLGITPVPQTSEGGTTPQANLAGYGVVAGGGHGFIKSFTEHCLLIGLVCLRADLNYQQGLNRMFSRSTRYDFYWPALSHIGEQAVLNKEIYAVGTGGATDDDVFGYQERYAEYRYKPSIVTGAFRSNHATSLDAWHLAQEFGALPVLNSSFIQEDPPIDRVIAVPAEPHLILDTYNDLKCVRPMPVYSVPGLIDHF